MKNPISWCAIYTRANLVWLSTKGQVNMGSTPKIYPLNQAHDEIECSNGPRAKAIPNQNNIDNQILKKNLWEENKWEIFSLFVQNWIVKQMKGLTISISLLFCDVVGGSSRWWRSQQQLLLLLLLLLLLVHQQSCKSLSHILGSQQSFLSCQFIFSKQTLLLWPRFIFFFSSIVKKHFF